MNVAAGNVHGLRNPEHGVMPCTENPDTDHAACVKAEEEHLQY